MTRAGKYLTFKMNDELYGVAILKVQEIIGMLSVTRMPKTPDFMRGVVDLRGKIIPVVDLRVKFGMTPRPDSSLTCIIVLEAGNGSGATIGVIVDEVREVVQIGEEQIEDSPTFGSDASTEFIMGVGKVNHRVVMLLDMDQALGFSDGANEN